MEFKPRDNHIWILFKSNQIPTAKQMNSIIDYADCDSDCQTYNGKILNKWNSYNLDFIYACFEPNQTL